MGRVRDSRLRLLLVVVALLGLVAGGFAFAAAHAAPLDTAFDLTVVEDAVRAVPGGYEIDVHGSLHLLQLPAGISIGVPNVPVNFTGTNIAGGLATTHNSGGYLATVFAPDDGTSQPAAATIYAKALALSPLTEVSSEPIVISLRRSLRADVSGGVVQFRGALQPVADCGPGSCVRTLPRDRPIELVAADGAAVVWNGCTSSPCVVDMARDYSVSAVFASPVAPPKLTVKLDSELGEVLSSPPGIDCPKQCSAKFPMNTRVELRSVLHDATLFRGWSGTPCAPALTCRVTVVRDTEIGASFAPVINPPPAFADLTVRVVGAARGTHVISDPAGLDCEASCVRSFPQGKFINVAVTPKAGWRVSSIAGDCKGTATSCGVLLDQPRLVVVRLEPILTVTDPPPGINKCPVGLSCMPTTPEIFRFWDGPHPPFKVLLLLIALFALIGFPSALFNSTYEENEERILDGVRSRLRMPARARPNPRRWWLVAGLVVVGAMYAIAEQDDASATQFVAIVLGWVGAFSVTSLAMQLPEALVAGRPPRFRGVIRVLPTGLVVAALCAGVSYILRLHPGYVYGGIAGFAVTAGSRRREDRLRAAPIAAAGLAVTTLLGLLLWTHTQSWLEPSLPTLPKLALAEFAGGLIVLGAEGMVFDFLPVKFLHGEFLWNWNKRWWAVVAGVSLVLSGGIVTRFAAARGEYDVSNERLLSAYAAVVVFGLISVAFWNYFRQRAPHFGETENDEVAEPELAAS